MMMDKDPLTRLFDMHLVHGTAQLDLARKLLELGEADRERQRLDEKLFKSDLTDDEREQSESRFSTADDLVSKLREQIKKLVEELLGVPFRCVMDANL
jgi:hypothetical protein